MKKLRVLAWIAAAAMMASCSKTEAPKNEEPKPVVSSGSSAVSAHLLALLPADNEVAGWTRFQTPRAFKPDYLFEYIDGAADEFLVYGFKEVASADYKQAGTAYEAVVDLYEMMDPLHAFGKYAQERNPSYSFQKIGNEGCLSGTGVNFWTGPYYVKIAAFEEKEEIRQELIKLAQAVAGKVKNPGNEPVEFSWFPKADQLPHTSGFIPKDVLEQSYLANGFETRYKSGAKEYKLILIECADGSAAREALTQYRKYLSSSGKDVKDIKAPGEGGFSGKDSLSGEMAAVLAGSRIAIALGAPTPQAAVKAMGELVGNIKN
jgi:hypothetical protein